jgi:hypothetical protein
MPKLGLGLDLATRALGNLIPWTPKYISTQFWYDPSDAGTITTSGSTVTQVIDKSGNGYTLSVITAGKFGPTIGTRKLNGLNVFEYGIIDPNNQILENSSFSYDQAANPLSLAMIFRSDAEVVATQDFFFAGTENTTTRLAVRKTTLDAVQMLGTGTTIGTANGIAPDNVDFILVAKWNSTNSQLRLNGSLLNSGNIGTTPFSSINLGANEAEASGVEGYIAEVIAFSDSSQQERIEGYLAWKWGLVGNLPNGHSYKASVPYV